MRITEELLRKRAEHNEGMLSNLEEVSLSKNNAQILDCSSPIRN
jgi:hypothetical protein